MLYSNLRNPKPLNEPLPLLPGWLTYPNENLRSEEVVTASL